MNEMPERIWAGHNGLHSTIRLLKKPILGIPADVEYVRADLLKSQCPFCGEKDYDLVGLKHHLMTSCKIYSETKQ